MGFLVCQVFTPLLGWHDERGYINTLQLAVVVLTFLLVTFFDTTGTLVGLTEQAGIVKDNKIPRIGRALTS